MIRQIYLQNQSKLVSADECKLIARACDWQLRHHAGPAWERTPWRVLLSNVDPSASMPLVILDDADQGDALGFHDETPDGRVYARVFARPILDSGGTILHGHLSVAVTASHEVLESFLDPHCQLWADDDGHVAWALEVADPVEAKGYAVPNYAGGAWVSNFVFPSFFDSRDSAGSYDQLGVLTRPFTLDDGGYAIVVREGTVSEIFAEHHARWRRERTRQHPASRSHRRRLATFAGGPLLSERVTEPPPTPNNTGA
jgi:hypothetical protein